MFPYRFVCCHHIIIHTTERARSKIKKPNHINNSQSPADDTNGIDHSFRKALKQKQIDYSKNQS